MRMSAGGGSKLRTAKVGQLTGTASTSAARSAVDRRGLTLIATGGSTLPSAGGIGGPEASGDSRDGRGHRRACGDVQDKMCHV
mmetsp:Transcript_115/g.259  ORF Transcript_115/g.259 Transcript_115/m.259 type:complete len:83 (+) Transcript_115:378-626(+)